MNFEAKIEPLLIQPTLEPTIEPLFPEISTSPSLEPSLEPTIEPTLIEPTSQPTFIEDQDNYKILNFSVDIEINNYKNNKLSDNDKIIILLAFEEITGVNTKYLSIKNKNLRRKLSVIFLNNNYYTFIETVFVSIPLIKEYNVYNPKPVDLYDLIVDLITEAFYLGTFETIVKEYNSSSLNDIKIDLLGVSDPVVRDSTQKDNNEDSHNKDIKQYELILIIVFGTIGLFILHLLIFKTPIFL